MTTTRTTRNTCAKVFTFLIIFTLTVITSATLATLSPHYAKHAERRFQAQMRHNQQVPLSQTIFAPPKPNEFTRTCHSRTGNQGVVV